MRTLKLAGSAYLAVMTGWVLVHFTEHTFFEEHPEEDLLEESDRFAALDVFMAAALILTAITAYQAMRRAGGQSPPAREWLWSSLFFYFTILVAIPFFANWFASLGHSDDGLLWIYVETMGPLTWTVQAIRLWRSAREPVTASV